MAQTVPAPTPVPVPGVKVIDEFGDSTLVLAGSVLVGTGGEVLEIGAHQAVITAPGQHARYCAGPDRAEYVAVCLPAFTPQGAP